MTVVSTSQRELNAADEENAQRPSGADESAIV